MPKTKALHRKSYHHGNLVEVLLAVTIEIIEERGVEHVSVREAAKRAGVSPAAPFQHFRSKTALLTAVAEQAMGRLMHAYAAVKSNADPDQPLAVLEELGRRYLQWAVAHPTHFEIINSRTLIDFEASDSLRTQNAAIRQRMVELLTEARERGHLIEGLDLDYVVLTARALVYGLARMAIDGHFPRWHPSEPPPQAMRQALRLFIGQITVSSAK
ncbi:MAG TPA: TetR/AcrR family transcriptional regulator [Aestuariivirga sp.]|nr:TetR/AcrR family transcriptional regulator [Aestuariivirga sp.]